MIDWDAADVYKRQEKYKASSLMVIGTQQKNRRHLPRCLLQKIIHSDFLRRHHPHQVKGSKFGHFLSACFTSSPVFDCDCILPGSYTHLDVYKRQGLTALQSIAAALPLGAVSAAANALPLGSMGFGWVLPALAGLAGGLLLNKSDLQ